MIGFALGLIGLAKNYLTFRQAQGQQSLQQQAQFWAYQSAYIQYTSDIETRTVRQLIVLTLFLSLWSSQIGATVATNFAHLPPAGQVILLWEFFGAAALNLIPWYKGGAGAAAAEATGLDSPIVNSQLPISPQLSTPGNKGGNGNTDVTGGGDRG